MVLAKVATPSSMKIWLRSELHHLDLFHTYTIKVKLIFEEESCGVELHHVDVFHTYGIQVKLIFQEESDK